MADNEQVDRYTTEIDVREANGLRNKVKNIGKNLKNNIPETITNNILYKANTDGLKFANKSLKQATKDWNKFQKQAAGGIFGDKRQAQDVNNFFGKLKMALIENKIIYDEQLKQLKGGNGVDIKDTIYGELSEALNTSKQKGEQLAKTLDDLKAKQLDLQSKKEQFELLPSVKDIKQQQAMIQRAMANISKQKRNSQLEAVDNESVKQEIFGAMQNVMARFDYTAQMAQSIKNFGAYTKDNSGGLSVTRDSTLWDKMVTRVSKMEQSMNEQESSLTSELDTLTATETQLEQSLQAALDNFANKHESKYKLEVEGILRQLDEVRSGIERTSNELDKLDMNKQLVKGYKKSLANAERTRGEQYNYRIYGKGLYADAMHNYAMANDKETTMMNKLSSSTPSKSIESLDKRYAELDKYYSLLRDEEKIATSNANDKLANEDEIKKVNKEIKDTEKAIQNNTDATKALADAMGEVDTRVQAINNDLKLMNEDLERNPISQRLQSDALKPFNNTSQELTRRWGVLGNLIERIRGNLSGIKGYMKQLNPLSKVLHKVVVNIYSQIAAMINPLTLVRKAWNSWLDRFDNQAWKNIFDVISYNLVTVIAPALEWCAKEIVRITAVLNVFTKKFAGVDLFDKTAWRLEQIKKGAAQLTASFDELHSTTDNPDKLNTIFDSNLLNTENILKDMNLSGWEKFASGIKKIFDGIGPFISEALKKASEHPLLALGAILGGMFATKLVKGIISGVGSWSLNTFLNKVFGGSKVAETVGTNLGTEAAKGAAQAGTATGMTFAQTVGNVLKGAGGAVLMVAGNAMVHSGVQHLSGLWDQLDDGEKVLYGLETAGGLAASTIGGALLGSAIGSFGGPIGAMGGAIIGFTLGAGNALITWATTSKDNIMDLQMAEQRYADAQMINEEAQYNYAKALENSAQASDYLKQIEDETGISGERLAEQIKNGTITVDDMTSAQKRVYAAYLQSEQSLQTLIKAEERAKESAANTIKANIEVELSNGKKSRSYEKAKEAIIKANEEGMISDQEAADYFSRICVNLNKTAKEQLLNGVKDSVKNMIHEEDYQSPINKMFNWIANKFSSAGKLIESSWNAILGKGFKTGEQISAEIQANADKMNTEQKLNDLSGEKRETQISSAKQFNEDLPQQSTTKIFSSISKAAKDAGFSSQKEYEEAELKRRQKLYGYAVGTNYVPNDGLAYLHQGEAVIPTKYNKPYQPDNNGELRNVISEMRQEISQLRQTLNNGINVKGEFKQRGSDLVATVEKAKNKNGNQPISNPAFAR